MESLCAVSAVSEWLLIFARAPQVGRVKTRLSRDIGPIAATQLYAAMLRDTLNFAQFLPRANMQISLVFTPQNAFEICDEANLSQFWNGARVPQIEGDLGDKMRAASTWAFECGAKRVVLIGTDSPDLPSEIVTSAFRQLENANCEMVVSPARDGGFTLLGMSQSCAPQLFANIDWTQNQTRAPLLQNAAQLGWRVSELPMWFDVDDINDLHGLQTRLQKDNSAPNCAHWLRENAHKYLQMRGES